MITSKIVSMPLPSKLAGFQLVHDFTIYSLYTPADPEFYYPPAGDPYVEINLQSASMDVYLLEFFGCYRSIHIKAAVIQYRTAHVRFKISSPFPFTRVIGNANKLVLTPGALALSQRDTKFVTACYSSGWLGYSQHHVFSEGLFLSSTNKIQLGYEAYFNATDGTLCEVSLETYFKVGYK